MLTQPTFTNRLPRLMFNIDHGIWTVFQYLQFVSELVNKHDYYYYFYDYYYYYYYITIFSGGPRPTEKEDTIVETCVYLCS